VTVTVGRRGIFRLRVACLVAAIGTQFISVGQEPETLIPSAFLVLVTLALMWRTVVRHLAWQERQQTDPPGDANDSH
jgi:hypothetical protein